jgi:hypothetical protein
MKYILRHYKASALKASFVTLLFLVVYLFYNSELIREHVEDIAFDTINKYFIKTEHTDTKTPQVMIFAIDDLYMKEQHLYDEYNQSNYGYLFPRDKIADFIERVDELCSNIERKNLPKALFIDYDMSFTSLPYGKKLSKEDKKLLDLLKRERPYKILLPKTRRYNFVEQSDDPDIQNAIKRGDIIFVSVAFLKSRDGSTRRYNGYRYLREDDKIKKYISVDIGLWQLINYGAIDINSSDERFKKDDIIANRIWFKSYSERIVDDGCSMQKSYWEKLSKYSANCSLFDIVEEDFAGSVLMLGGTHRYNGDSFSVLNVHESETLSGIDMHANALMTMLYLGKGMQRLSLGKSLAIVFFSFFIISLSISVIFSILRFHNEEFEFMTQLLLNTIALISISAYLIHKYNLWFNWFIPLILFELVEIYDYVENFIPLITKFISRSKV